MTKDLRIEIIQRHDIYGGPWAIQEIKDNGERMTLLFLDGKPVLEEVQRLRRLLNKAEIERAWALGAFNRFQAGDRVSYLGIETTIQEVITRYVLAGGTVVTAAALRRRTAETTGDGAK